MTEVVAALIWEGETFLICQRPAHKARGLLWEFVGGKVEPGGGDPEEALVRECREELDIRVAVGGALHGGHPRLSRPYRPLDPVSCLHRGGNAPKAGASGHPVDPGGRDPAV